MGTKQVSAEYLSVGANRQTSVADWSATGLLAFGADVNIALWRPALHPPRGVESILRGHKDTVKAVLFLPQDRSDNASYIVSGSDDKTLIVWKESNEEERHQYEAVRTSSEHTAPLNCVTAVRVSIQPAKWIMATGAADASIKIWSLEDDQLHLLQSIKTTPKFFPLTMSLSTIDGDVLILAAAGTRETVQILTADLTTSAIDFSLQATLHGHEGWVRSLSFTRESNSKDSDLLLASASQDKYIRIWRIHRGTELPSLAASGSDPLSGAFLPGKSPSNKAHRLKAAGKDFSITFEALLLGHEDWIYSARWHTNAHGKLQLLSTSADNSLAIWEADRTSGIWVSMVRLGEISREKGATTATGSTGGFWTGLWSPDGKSVACLGRTGSWRRWEHDLDEDSWKPCVAITGHTKAVTGVAWSKSGNYLLSTSSDQTSRLHTKWTAAGDAAGTWHEMSRPQIHGYDLNCIDTLDDTQFVSGADEKLMRVFRKPKAVAMLLNRLAGHGSEDVQNMPHAANMPVLGLSNKAIEAVDDDQEIQPIDDRDRDAMDPASVVKKSHLEIDHPPFEETLSRHTLWPEAEKLYGHGYEISCLAASHDGKLVASACKASSTNHAVIRLFETEKWTEIRPPLVAHSLTTTRLRFSADDRYLLSVGRDRQWAVFERDTSQEAMYKLLQSNLKGHSRMILDAAWAPSDRPLFATAGRDKQVRIWSAKKASESDKLEFSQSVALSCSGPVTAVDFFPADVDGSFVLAVGTEAGKISICLLNEQCSSTTELETQAEFSLPKAVLQLAWRPVKAGTSTTYTLAVAGEDGSLRLFSFDKSYLRAS
ncbi:hypothetical protein E4U43_007822 [Claviceps pusilla]|uniref:Elongator complex protein 2 n=1 Tax=Claviceps pusilla TaxID=123648 RepID=A0A9P7NCF1_9HYPO|nr:hypothetical protein E4U43_007822 [Claviceps pusilla]